jgi:rare lipoprotein A
MLLLFIQFINPRRSLRRVLLVIAFMACGAGADAGELHPAGPVHEPVIAHPALDRSGHKRLGKASFYARQFSGRKMADGTIMQPQGDNAASKTLPLGTTARVTNLENGRSAVVTIRDRGPYIQGRIVDLSPGTAQKIGIERKNGVAKVEVAPILVPLADGHVKLGAAITDNQRISRLALSADNFAQLPNAEFPGLVKMNMGH